MPLFAQRKLQIVAIIELAEFNIILGDVKV
jgi:hypothetical protein